LKEKILYQMYWVSFFLSNIACSDSVFFYREYYFSDTNLFSDEWLRRQMNDEGWIPATLIAGFNMVRMLTSDISLILDAAKNSTKVEVNADSIRPAKNWAQWPLPPRSQLPQAVVTLITTFSIEYCE